MVRTKEARFAHWAEFEGLDGPEPLWRISAERMKMRREHLVPLAPRSVAILARLKTLAYGSPFVFPAPTRTGVTSENTFLFAVYRMGYHTKATVHGFRGTASTVLNEQGFNRDWIEMQLAHVQGGVRAACQRRSKIPPVGRSKITPLWFCGRLSIGPGLRRGPMAGAAGRGLWASWAVMGAA
jgi:integrase